MALAVEPTSRLSCQITCTPSLVDFSVYRLPRIMSSGGAVTAAL